MAAKAGANFTPTEHHDTYAFISTKHRDLSGRSVFITGASKGIGRETALSFAKAGASYIGLAARSSFASLEPELHDAARAAGHSAPKLLTVSLDVTEAESVEAAAKRVRSEFGRLDVLVNNAGRLEEPKPIGESDPESWWRTYEVNIKGPYLLARAFLPLLLETVDGLKTILNVSSVGAHLIRPGMSSYQSSKLTLLRLGEFIQTEYGNQGILCYGVHPGGVLTELASSMAKELHPLLRDKPQLAADTIVWLTGERRDWLAGRYVSANWDMEELESKREEIVKGDLLKVRLVC